NPSFTSVENDTLLPTTSGETTVGRVSLTPDQKLLIVSLCEDFLRRAGAGQGQIPSSAAAAERLGWKVTKFNRKLDNVCQKLADAGIRGLHGGPGKLASNRKSRLVEHALSTRMVTEEDLCPRAGTAATESCRRMTEQGSVTAEGTGAKRPRSLWVRMISGTIVAVLVAVAAIFALRADGEPVHDVALTDGNVWVSGG